MKKLTSLLFCLFAAYSIYAQPWATMVEDYTTGKDGTFTDGIYRGSMGKLTYGQGIYTANGKFFFNRLHDNHLDPYAFDGSQFTQLAELGTATYPRPYVAYNGKVYFIITGGTDRGFWVSDGTQSGTKKLVSVHFVIDYGYETSKILLFNGKMYFIQNYEENSLIKSAIWVSDGTVSGTKRLIDVAADPDFDKSAVWSFEVANNKLLFKVGYFPGDLWVSDGTQGGTNKVQNDWEYTQAQYNGSNYFIRYDNTGTGLYSTDGTQTGTQLVKQLYTGDMSATQGRRDYMGVYNGKLIFVTFNGEDASQLWTSNGTEAGTERLAEYRDDFIINSVVYRTMNNKFFFSVSLRPENISYLAVTDGTTLGTKLLKDFEMGSIIDPYLTHEFSGKLFYSHIVGGPWIDDYCDAIYYTDGTEAGTGKVEGGMAAIGSVAPVFGTLNGEMYLIGYDETHGAELWRLFDFSLGVASIKEPATQALYPNPANHSFNVNTEDVNNTTVCVYSLAGQLLLQTRQTQHIDVQALPVGIYSVQVACNGKVQHSKLVKE